MGRGAASRRARSLLVVVNPRPPPSPLGLTSSRVEETELRQAPAPTASAHTKTHTLLNLPRPRLPGRQPRRAGDALTASRWSPVEASAAHKAPSAAIPLRRPRPVARAARMLIGVGGGAWGGAGHPGHAPLLFAVTSPHFFPECPLQILPASEEFSHLTPSTLHLSPNSLQVDQG